MSVIVADADTLWCCTRCRAIYRKESAFCPADGGEVVSVRGDPMVDTEVGPYVIDELLGQGAMGRVYRAHHKHLQDRACAVKVLLGDLASTQEMRIRFLNEARNASRMSHPNVVTVFDVGRTEGGLLYLAMELVEGEPLSALIDRGAMEPMVAAKLALGVCAGLAHAHARGIVHRDLKPENVIVVHGPDGKPIPRIVDFGIAVSIEQGDTRLTATGMSMGTPGYIAPEQLTSVSIDARVDQYALGVTLFEMLTGGNLPFRGSAMEIAAAKTSKDAPPISTCMPDGVTVPPGLARIVDRMLARNPARRYPSIEAVERVLARWTSAPATDVIENPGTRRSRLTVAAGVGLALAISGGVAWVTLRDGAADSDATPRPAAGPAVAAADAPVRPEPRGVPVAAALATDARDDADPEDRPTVERRERTSASTRKPKSRPRVVASAATTSSPAQPPRVEPAPPPPAPVAAPPPPSVMPSAGKVRGVTVTGALSQTEVRRALQRIEPALERCTSASPATVVLRFTIDDSRRPRDVRGSGISGSTLSCLISAISKARVEVAPDVGDADVAVSIQFTGSS